MPITNIGQSGAMLRIGSNVGAPDYIGIGTGSATASVNNTGLVAHSDRNQFSTRNFATQKKWTFTADWGSSEISGTNLKEFGVFVLNSGGKLWQREGFANVAFDGTNELQIEITWEVY